MPAPRRGALQPARLHQEPRPPQFRVVEAFDDHLGPARQAGQRVEIAGIENEDAGHQLVQTQPAGPTARQLVDRQPPAGIERPSVDDDAATAQQRLETGERGHRVQLVDNRQQRRGGGLAHHRIGEAARLGLGDRADAMPGQDVGVRLI